MLAPVRAEPALGQAVPGTPGYLAAEYLFAATHEQATDAHRRAHPAHPRGDRAARQRRACRGDVAALVAPVLGWDADRQAREVDDYLASVRADRAALADACRWDPGRHVPWPVSEERRGFLSGLGAYPLWGVFPLYFQLLDPAGSVEVLAHRIMWSLLVVLGLLALRHGWGRLRAVLADRRRMGYLAVAAAVISVNWGVFIWATTHDHVVDTVARLLHQPAGADRPRRGGAR